MVSRDGGHVVALSVLRRAQHSDGDGAGESAGSNVRELAETLLSELRRDMPVTSDVRLSSQVVYADADSPAQVVTDYAMEHGFDVLVLGRHGNGRRRKARLGRVAERAAQACGVPVLLLSSP